MLSHTVSPVPPTLIFFLIGALVLSCISFSTGKIYNYGVIAFPFFCAVYYFISQSIMAAPFGRFMGVVLAILYFVFTASYANLFSEENRTKQIHHFINLSVIILVIECIWRFTHPEESFRVYSEMGDPRWIYMYKFGGLMYKDSNAVAIHIVVVLFFIVYRQKYFNEKHRLSILILLVLLFFTISRAAWIGTFIGYLYIRFLHRGQVMAYITGGVAFVVILGVVFFFVRQAIQNDLSFLSKFDILQSIQTYFSTVNWKDLIFGVGFSRSEEKLGVYAHNLLMVFLIESGIIGLALLLMMFVHFLIITRMRAMFVLVPLFITTLSATITFMPFFYMVMGLMYIDSKVQRVRRES